MRRPYGPGITAVHFRIERDPEIQALLMRQARLERAAARALVWNTRMAIAVMVLGLGLIAWNCLPLLALAGGAR